MRFFDFFAGIGGFRLGMEMAGHECVGHCEVDKYANMSYTAMHHPKESEVFFEDVRTIDLYDMPECECYCFGFPCQSFSIAGGRNGFRDPRGTLFFEVMRIAEIRHPKILFAENVKGLLNHDGGETFGTIIRTMDAMGYDVEWQLLNSKHYGVPQNRERVFIIGHFRGEPTRKIFPIGEWVGLDNIAKRCQDSTRIIANTLDTRINGMTRGTYITDTGAVMKVDGYHKLKKGGKRLNVSGARMLTPRECFRLQGFPDEYFERAAKVCSDSQLYKQAGNSVTVNVIYEIAKRL